MRSRSTPCGLRSGIAEGWCTTTRSSSSGCTTSSTRWRRDCQHPLRTVAAWLDQPSGQAVLACAAAFAGRAPTVRSLQTRATGRLAALTPSTGCNGGVRVYRRRTTPGSERSGWRDLARHQALQADIAAVEVDLEQLLADTAGQVLTSLPGVAMIRAAGFAANSLPIDRFPDAAHLYSATASPQRSTSRPHAPRGPDIAPRTGRAPRRADGYRLGPVPVLAPFAERDVNTAPGACTDPGPGRPGPARLPPGIPNPNSQEPFDEELIVKEGTVADGDGHVAMPFDGAI